MKASKRISRIEPSLTRKMFNLAQNFDDVIDLTLGDPDLAPPKELRQAAYRAMEGNKLRYSANAGLPEARRAVSKKIAEVWGQECALENIAITVGGMEALFLSLYCMIDEGDEVIVFAPYYINYLQMIELCGGKPVVVDAYNAQQGLYVNRDVLEAAVTDKTIAIIINSPNNPTGDVFSREMLRDIAVVAQAHDLSIISDEVYRTLLYDGRTHESVLQFPEAAGRTLVVDSMSKEYSMTGWRIGFAFGPQELIANMVKMQENVAACANVASQYALLEAYQNKVPNHYIVEEFQERRDYLYSALKEINLLRVQKPKGTFYLFVDISQTGYRSEEFAYKLLEDVHVAVVPGVVYGKAYDGYIRVAFTRKVEVLEEAVQRFQTFFDKLEKGRS